MKKKTKIDWKLIWKQFHKLCDAADYFWEGNWKEQKIIFYTVVNQNLPPRKRLDNYDVEFIEKDFKRWFNSKATVNHDWKYQKKLLMKLIEKAKLN